MAKNKIISPFLLILSLVWGIFTFIPMPSHGMEPGSETSIKSAGKKPPKKESQIGREEHSQAIIEHKLVQEAEQEIEKGMLKRPNEEYDRAPYGKIKGTPEQDNGNKVINQQRRDRYTHIRAAIEDMYKSHLIVAEYFLWNNNVPNSEQVGIWKKYFEQLDRVALENYNIEVHYINLDEPKFTDVVSYNFKQGDTYTFRHEDNKRIISTVIFKPKAANHENKAPVGIYNHGGAPDNKFTPSRSNPMFPAFIGLGYAIICPNYRGGSAVNHEVDMAAVVQYLKQLDYIDTAKIVLAGISAGTTLNAQILDKPIANDFAGVFLHTGLYGVPGLADAMLGVPQQLPIFLASGRNDGLTDIKTTLTYVRALQDISKNFTYFVLDHGGHQLIQAKDGAVPLELNSDNIQNIQNIQNIMSIQDHYNADEMMDYITHLVEFLDRIAHGEVPTSYQKSPEARVEPIELKKPATLPTGEDIIRKARLGQEVKQKPELPVREDSKNNPELPVRKDGKKPSVKWQETQDPRFGPDIMQKSDKLAPRFGPDIMQKSDELDNALYTPSQAQLKILLGDDYNEKLRTTIINFLKKYDSEKESIGQEFAEEFSSNLVSKNIDEVSSQNEDLINRITQILTKESQYKGNYVLYHGADSRAGFIYDVYTALHNLFTIQGKTNPNKQEQEQIVGRLRLLDDVFEKIMNAEDLITQTRPLEQKDTQTVFNYLGEYQKVGISAQWFLFGSYKYWFNSTFLRYFLESGTGNDVSVETILKEFFSGLGLTNEDDLQKAIEDYTKIYNSHIDPNDGRLLQIFISPSIIDEVAYMSETGGYPLDLSIPGVKEPTHAPSKIILEALKTPQTFETILKNNRANFKRQNSDDRIGFFNDVNNMVYVNALEARFFMKPEYMDDPTKVQIINYHLIAPKPGYSQALQEAAAKSLGLWLNVQPKLGPAMTRHKPPLVKLQEYVQKGVGKTIGQTPPQRQAFTLYDLLSSGNRGGANEWIKAHPKDMEAKMDAQGHPLLYQLLKDNKFEAAKILVHLSIIQNMTPPIVDGKDTKGDPIIIDFVSEGNVKAFTWLAQNGANLNATNAHGSTPLIFASIRGLTEAVEVIIKNRIWENNSEGLKKYLDQKNKYGTNALMFAIDKGHESTALTLIDAGADINATNARGVTPLTLASILGLTEVVEVIIKNRIWENNPEGLKKYLDQKNKYGTNALILAIDKRHENIALTLMNAGADINATNARGVTPLTLASALGLTEVVEAIINNEIWKTNPEGLKEYLDQKSKTGNNALILAIDKGHKNTALRLMNAGADISATNADGDTPLIFASTLGLTEVVEAIINNGIWKTNSEGLKKYLDQKSKTGNNALILAIDKGHKNTALRLMNAGADINAKNAAGTPVIYNALTTDHFDLAKKLIDKGVNLRATAYGRALIIQLLLQDKYDAAKFLLNSLQGSSLNIPDTLKTKIQNGQNDAAKEEAKEEAKSLTTLNWKDRNGKLWDALTTNLYDWESLAEEAIKENPNRNVIEGKINGVHKLCLYFLLEKDKYDQAQWLMENGADVNRMQVTSDAVLKEKEKRPILLDVLMWDPKFINDSIKSADLLIKYGANVNANYTVDGVEKPILHKLLKMADYEFIINYLIDKGADVNVAFGDEKQPILLERLLLWDDTDRERYGKILIERGANVNAFYENEGERKPILYNLLLNSTDEDAAQWLITNGADVNAKLEKNQYPIILQVLTDFNKPFNISDAEFLIKNKANVNERTGNGQRILTALLISDVFEEGEIDVEKKINAAIFLVKKGAKMDPGDLDLKTEGGETIREFITNSKDAMLKGLLGVRVMI